MTLTKKHCLNLVHTEDTFEGLLACQPCISFWTSPGHLLLCSYLFPNPHHTTQYRDLHSRLQLCLPIFVSSCLALELDTLIRSLLSFSQLRGGHPQLILQTRTLSPREAEWMAYPRPHASKQGDQENTNQRSIQVSQRCMCVHIHTPQQLRYTAGVFCMSLKPGQSHQEYWQAHFTENSQLQCYTSIH